MSPQKFDKSALPITPLLHTNHRKDWFNRNGTILMGSIIIILLACLGVTALNTGYNNRAPILSSRHDFGFDIEQELNDVVGRFDRRCKPCKHHKCIPTQMTTTAGRYPLTPPIRVENSLKYSIGMVADMDKASKTKDGNWRSYLKRGSLNVDFNRRNPAKSKVSIEWATTPPQSIVSDYNVGGRGMELSELITFDNRIMTCDDRSGIVFSLDLDTDAEVIKPVPWVILANGNGSVPKGFKCEWASVKDGELIVGSIGKPWTTGTGDIVNFDTQFIKIIKPDGAVKNINWKKNYDKVIRYLSPDYEGYVWWESGGWSDILKKWMFLPRHVSTKRYNEKTDDFMGSNIIIFADEDFSNIQIRHVGPVVPTSGFSSFKWIPGTRDELVLAIKSQELNDVTATYVTVFTIAGEIIIPETKVADNKYEGIEFL